MAGDSRTLARVTAVETASHPLPDLAPIVGTEVMARFEHRAAETVSLMAGRTFWNVNSTATGGGVAEMLASMVGWSRALGIDARWLVIEGTPEFFAVTKRLHNLLHGTPGDRGPLGKAERAIYEEVLARNSRELLGIVRAGDIVLLHDPQTAGLVPALAEAGAHVVWRCHIGTDDHNEYVNAGWAFLADWLLAAETHVFTRAAYAPDFLDRSRVWLIPPSIDPFSPKNMELSDNQVAAIVAHLGLVEDGLETATTWTMRDGSPRRVERAADIVRAGRVPSQSDPLVVQVSRWDRLKDPAGVMAGFAEHVIGATRAHLALVGPSVAGVTDDPEGAEVFEECYAEWQALPSAARRRIQLVTLPMRDVDENAVMVNAIQRHAAVVVQKSLREGFGLTVAEAMWKARPVIGSAVGGIQDQVIDGVTGLLVDPLDPAAFGEALLELLSDPEHATTMGKHARERAAAEYSGPRQLLQYADLIRSLVST